MGSPSHGISLSIFTDVFAWSKFPSLSEAKGIDLAQLSKNVGRLGLMVPLAEQGLSLGALQA